MTMVQGKHDDGLQLLDRPAIPVDKKPRGTLAFPAGTLDPGVTGKKDFQAYVHERTRFKLGKYSLHIQRLGIRLKGTTTPGGDSWVSCCITIRLRQGEPMVIERSALLAQEALDHSLGVAELMVRRTLQKLQHRLA